MIAVAACALLAIAAITGIFVALERRDEARHHPYQPRHAPGTAAADDTAHMPVVPEGPRQPAPGLYARKWDGGPGPDTLRRVLAALRDLPAVKR